MSLEEKALSSPATTAETKECVEQRAGVNRGRGSLRDGAEENLQGSLARGKR